MMMIALLIASSLLTLAFALWIARGHAHPRQPHDVDLKAFRNLLSGEDEIFLRRSLNKSNYHKVRRARIRAIQEYLGWIADDCAHVIASLRSEVSGASPSIETGTLARKAMQLRATALGFSALLWLEYIVLRVEIRPALLLKNYEDLRHAILYLQAHPPAVAHGSGTA